MVRMLYSEKTRKALTPSRKVKIKQAIPKCEVCHKRHTNTLHHIRQVVSANGHKDLNKSGNLLGVCKPCHKKIHKGNYLTQGEQRNITSKRSDLRRSRLMDALNGRKMAKVRR